MISLLVLIFNSTQLSAEYKYSIYPDSVMLEIEKKYPALEDQVNAIENYFTDLYHLIMLDYKNEYILPFFDKYYEKVNKLGNKQNIAYYNLNKGAYFIDSFERDSASTYFMSALLIFEEIEDFTGITHACIFIDANNNLSIPIRNKPNELIDFYFKKGFNASLISNDYFAKAAAAWNKALRIQTLSNDSLNYYCRLSFSYLLKLPDSQISKKFFGIGFISNMLDKYQIEPSLKIEITENLIETYRIVMSRKYFNTMNYKFDVIRYYRLNNRLDSAAFVAHQFINSRDIGIWRELSLDKISDYFYTIYDYEKSQGNYQEALLYYEKYHNEWIKLINADPRIKTVENERRTIQEQKDLEKLIHEQEQKFILILSGVALITLLVVSLYFYKRYKDRQRIGSELEKLILAKDKLFSIVSHDLRNPVASLKQMLDIVVLRYDKLDDESKHKYISNLRNSSNKLFLMLDNLLSWARINLGQIRCVRDDVDVFSIISNELEILEDMIESKNLKINLTEGREAIFNVDANIFRIIFRNIITNAIKFSPYNGKIDIELDKSLTTLNLKVRDFGAGISSETIAQIKSRAIIDSKSGTANERGNGLGLTIVSELVKLHNGEIEIESKMGEGTVVKISFGIEQS